MAARRAVHDTMLDHQFDFFKGSTTFTGVTADPATADERPLVRRLPARDPGSGPGRAGQHRHPQQPVPVETYLNHTWTTQPRLTLNWGVRYEACDRRCSTSRFDLRLEHRQHRDLRARQGPMPDEIRQFPTLRFVSSRDAGTPTRSSTPQEQRQRTMRRSPTRCRKTRRRCCAAGKGCSTPSGSRSTRPRNSEPTCRSTTSPPSSMAASASRPTRCRCFPTVTWDNLLSNPSILPGGTTFPRLASVRRGPAVERQPAAAARADAPAWSRVRGIRGPKLMQGFRTRIRSISWVRYTTPGRRRFPQSREFHQLEEPSDPSSYKALIVA